MMLFKLFQTHTTYDGLAIDVSESTAQSSVIAVLLVALLLAIPRRGVAFGKPRNIRFISFKQTLDFIKKYHGYVMSFGTVYNFHYHPASHRNKYWILLLETWVFIHGTLTAILQPGTNWQIFSYGFAIIFLINQIYDTPIPKRYPWILASLYTLFSVAVALGFQQNHAYYKMLFIPVAQFICLFASSGVVIGLAIILGGNLRVYNDY
ncbi:hypothetical protein BDC45DRAFT_546682 [Circinella umbellata]|nr:hypothetical protein BDC45DRAFT_546682 [Circinella umbellata]